MTQPKKGARAGGGGGSGSPLGSDPLKTRTVEAQAAEQVRPWSFQRGRRTNQISFFSRWPGFLFCVYAKWN